jgi:IS5 family transposase
MLNQKKEQCGEQKLYTGEPVEKILRRKEILPQIIERAFKCKPLTDKQITDNKEKSKIRCRCEHVFWFCKQQYERFLYIIY